MVWRGLLRKFVIRQVETQTDRPRLACCRFHTQVSADRSFANENERLLSIIIINTGNRSKKEGPGRWFILSVLITTNPINQTVSGRAGKSPLDCFTLVQPFLLSAGHCTFN